MSRGRPFEPGNKHGKGRPKGIRNEKVQQALKLLEQNATALVAMAINQSPKDSRMRRLLLSRFLSLPRELPVRIGRLPIGTLADLELASAIALQMVTAGEIRSSQARDLTRLIGSRRSVLKALDLERQIGQLENRRIAEEKRPTKFQGTGEEMMALFRTVGIQHRPEEE
jgi:hypothetical protein